MLKEVDGLPNEMKDIISDLMGVFTIQNLTESSPSQLANMYLSNLYKIRVAAQNKAIYDKAVESAQERGAMNEPAIAPNGDLVVQDVDTGKITAIDLQTYQDNQDQYSPLSVSQLATLRRFDPSLSQNQTVFSIIGDSMGYNQFQNLLSQALSTIGSSEVIREGAFSAAGNASKGLEILQSLSQDDRVQALGSITAEGLYQYKIIDKNQLGQINSLISYLVHALPKNAKTWAAMKLGVTDADKGAAYLIQQYLLGKSTNEHSFAVQQTKGSGDGESGQDPNEGFWRQVQSGKGGEDTTFNFLKDNGHMSTRGKYYGTTPGLTNNKSLSSYINDSQVGYLIKNNNSVTFGDAKLSTDSWGDVMVNANGGAAVMTLPANPDGTVDLEAAPRYIEFLDEVEKLDKTSPSYKKQVKQLAEEKQVDNLFKEDGTINKNRFGQYLVLEGYTSERAKVVGKDSKQASIESIKSDYIIPAGEDDATYDMIEQALSTKDHPYELTNSIWRSDDDLFKGNIYIPLNTNPLNAFNADENNVKESRALDYEKMQQQSTRSDVL